MVKKYANKLVWLLYQKLYLLRWRLRVRNQDWVLGRVACMGQDVYKLLNIKLPLFNVQKGRVDYCFETKMNPKLKTQANKVSEFIERNDIKLLMVQQESCGGRYSRRLPAALYMDSYSELTDQMFVQKSSKWRFCANYSDITHTAKFKRQFESIGLIPVENLLDYYRNYFKLFRDEYGSVPIIFLHFPVTLDNRDKFHVRHKYIMNAIIQVSKEFQPFYSFAPDESIVGWPEEIVPGLENFPYHYNQETYNNLAEQIKSAGLLSELRK